MRPGILRRLTPLVRRSPIRRRRKRGYTLRPWLVDHVTPELWMEVMERDAWRCVAVRFDAGHVCEGRMTFEHVPELGKNAYGKKPPHDRYHGVAACLGAQQGWCLTHRLEERAWLAVHYGQPPYPSPEALDEGDRPD